MRGRISLKRTLNMDGATCAPLASLKPVHSSNTKLKEEPGLPEPLNVIVASRSSPARIKTQSDRLFAKGKPEAATTGNELPALSDNLPSSIGLNFQKSAMLSECIALNAALITTPVGPIFFRRTVATFVPSVFISNANKETCR